MKSHRLISRQSLINWTELIVLVMLFSGVIILVNYIAYKNNKRFDLTPEKTYSLSPHSLRILNSLPDDVYATIFYRPKERRDLLDIVGLFSRASSRFHYSFVDLEKNPAKAEAFGIKSFGAGIVKYRGKREKVQYFTEENLISAIVRLTEKSVKTVRFVKGHGEKDISSYDAKNGYNKVRQALETENFQVEDILLMQVEKVPDDTLILVVSGPQKDFFQKELDLIDEYLKNGGRLLMLCDPFPLPKIESYLQSLNIQLARDFIIDEKSKLIALDDLTPIIIPDKNHPIARYMNEVVVFPVCRSVIPLDESEMDIFAYSSPESWAEQDTQSVYDGKASFDKGKDIKGPVPVAAVALVKSSKEGHQTKEPGRLVVMGDSDFVSNHYFNILGNKDLFLNTVNWLAEKSELLSVRAKAGSAPVSLLFLTENESRLVLFSSVIIEPGIILLIGIAVVLWRRIKR